MNNETKKEFYARCGEILGIEHHWKEPVKRRTRWNTRFLGNGRYEGFGTIRCFHSSMFHVISRHGVKTFKKPEEVYDFLKKVTKSC